jgi:Bacterial transcriptional activator domain
LRVPDGELDVQRFDELVRRADAAAAERDADRAAALLREALGLWRGPPLADLAYEPAVPEHVERLEERRLGVIEERIEADLARGRHAEVLPELDELIAQHPLRERLRGQQMVALYRSGRQADALAADTSPNDSVLGPLELDRNGEPLTHPFTVLRAHHGVKHPDDAIDVEGTTLVEIIMADARLVGAPCRATR